MRGCHVRSGRRQSIPSSSIDNCAVLSKTVPVSACGQTNRPRSRRFVNRHMPSPSLHKSLTRSPLRPRDAKTWPQNGSSLSAIWTWPPASRFRSACPSRRRPATPVSRRAARSCALAQRTQHTAQHRLVNVAAKSQLGAGNLKLDDARATCAVGRRNCRHRLNSRRRVDLRNHANRQQRRRLRHG